MPGSYVAKPPVIIIEDYPDGWNAIWPFPGALPPGYGPEYSIEIEAPESVVAGETAVAKVKVVDHSTFKTTAPTENLQYSAETIITDNPTLNNSAYQIDADGYYSGNIYFSTDASNIGETINWSVITDPFGTGTQLNGSAETAVVADTPHEDDPDPPEGLPPNSTYDAGTHTWTYEVQDDVISSGSVVLFDIHTSDENGASVTPNGTVNWNDYNQNNSGTPAINYFVEPFLNSNSYWFSVRMQVYKDGEWSWGFSLGWNLGWPEISKNMPDSCHTYDPTPSGWPWRLVRSYGGTVQVGN